MSVNDDIGVIKQIITKHKDLKKDFRLKIWKNLQ